MRICDLTPGQCPGIPQTNSVILTDLDKQNQLITHHYKPAAGFRCQLSSLS